MRTQLRQFFLTSFLFVTAVFSQAQAGEPLQVLFVGNSYTFYNQLPLMVRQMSVEAKQPRALEVKDVTVAGSSLKQHWARGDVQKVLASQHWDYVVIQDFSLMPLQDAESTRKYAGLVAQAARQAGAQPIFYLTWARQNDPSMQSTLDAVYTQVAKENHGLLAPVGDAWKVALASQPQPTLFIADGSHPTYTGSYLAASVFYSLIYGNPPPAPQAAQSSRFEHATAAELQQDAWTALQSVDVALRTVPAGLGGATVQATR
ncbi:MULTISPECIES: SGNH/GDSL hydrolase family protein [Pseudomonas]|uniref:SGNH/GDSL hydrolase family protein n=1 Tax=Pseudomonas TaxID=286 RepID=UPI00257C783E|nr:MULTISPECIES: SGNH/GDSL hydrolase family protein [Pseudomonas]